MASVAPPISRTDVRDCRFRLLYFCFEGGYQGIFGVHVDML
jgi:hypothetical protein